MDLVRAVPDGHTLLLATMSVTGSNAAINPRSPYDPTTDITPIINIAASPSVLAIHPGFPARNYKDFIAEVKKEPGPVHLRKPGRGRHCPSADGVLLRVERHFHQAHPI